jgi:hypothetical protein
VSRTRDPKARGLCQGRTIQVFHYRPHRSLWRWGIEEGQQRKMSNTGDPWGDKCLRNEAMRRWGMMHDPVIVSRALSSFRNHSIGLNAALLVTATL